MSQIDEHETATNQCNRYAFPNDELLPVSNTFSNSRQARRTLQKRSRLTVAATDGELPQPTRSRPPL